MTDIPYICDLDENSVVNNIPLRILSLRNILNNWNPAFFEPFIKHKPAVLSKSRARPSIFQFLEDNSWGDLFSILISVEIPTDPWNCDIYMIDPVSRPINSGRILERIFRLGFKCAQVKFTGVLVQNIPGSFIQYELSLNKLRKLVPHRNEWLKYAN